MNKEKKNAKKVIKHIKSDIQTFKKEAREDRDLISSLRTKRDHKRSDKEKDPKKPDKKQKKVEVVMREFKEKSLKSSSGKPVKKRDQALAIAMNEAGLSKKKNK